MYKRLIPSILIHKGRLVKGKHFTGYKDAGNPATTARAHNYQSADELIVCDIDASKNNEEPDYKTLQAVAEECFMPLTMCGGINALGRAEKCMHIGADKLGLNTTALENPALLTDLAHIYGAQAVVLNIDVIKDNDGQYHIFDHRTGKEHTAQKTLLDWITEATDRGAGEIKITAVNNEGALQGFDLELYKRVREHTNVPVILEGGAGSLDDIQTAYSAGVDALALGAMLVFTDSNLVKIKQHMRTKKINLRA